MSATASPVSVAGTLLLTRWWSQPTDDERETWDALWPEAEVTAIALGLGVEALAGLRDAARDAESDTLLEEYERVFVGPWRVPCAPYESLWRTDAPAAEEGSLMGPSAEAMTEIYRRLDVDLRPDAHELPDHLLIECEALAVALATGRAEARELLDEHLGVWVPTFCEAVGAVTEAPFYLALASLTPRWLAALGG